MAKKEEKNPVGRPKLAASELIKDSWCKIAASLVIVFVLTICGVGVLTARTPLQVTFQNPNKLQGSVAKTITYRKVIPASKVKVIPAEHAETKKINSDGTVTRVIPAIKTKTISVSK